MVSIPQNNEADMLTTLYLFAAAGTGFLVWILAAIVKDAATPWLCRKLGHRPGYLGQHQFCRRCGRHL
jgi:hypothetical protein